MENNHIPRDAEGYITPNHYYGQNYQLLDVIEDQLSPEGVRGFTKGLIFKYLYVLFLKRFNCRIGLLIIAFNLI